MHIRTVLQSVRFDFLVITLTVMCVFIGCGDDQEGRTPVSTSNSAPNSVIQRVSEESIREFLRQRHF